jgi:hypothetical protein
VAVDREGNVVTSTDPRAGAAASWTVKNVDADNELTSVSCPSASLCVAVDYGGNVLTSTDPGRGAAATWRIKHVHGAAELEAQLQALPLGKLQRIEDLDKRAITLLTQRERNAEELDELPEPRRRFGRERDPYACERAHLNSALQGGERALHDVLAERSRLARELGDVPEVRAERDGLERAIGHSRGSGSSKGWNDKALQVG